MVSPLHLLALLEVAGSLSAHAAVEAKLALIQFDADRRFGASAENLQELTRLADRAVKQGARVVVFPEGSLHGYASPGEAWCRPSQASCLGRTCRDVSRVAEAVPAGPVSRHWEGFARERGVYVVASLIEREDRRFYNTAAIFGPRGFEGRYRKRSLYKWDRCFADAGASSAVLDTPFGRFGLMICMDAVDYPARFFDEYRAMGVRNVIVPMNWDEAPGSSKDARPYFLGKARETGFEIFAADSAAWDGTGHYRPGAAARDRSGLPPASPGRVGFSLHALPVAR